MKPRTENYHLPNGTARIEVRGDGSACGLFLGGKPFVFNFYDRAGSIGQDLYRFAPLVDNNRPAGLSEVTADLPPEDATLSRLILPLLQQFPSAAYTLTLAPCTDADAFVEYYLANYQQDCAYTTSGYYPFGEKVLVATQPDETLDDARIAHFWYAIEEGKRPFAITATTGDAMCEFVLDGHHKMRAYAHAGVDPWRLCITRSSSPLAENDWPTSVVAPRAWRAIYEPQVVPPPIDREAVRETARSEDRVAFDDTRSEGQSR
ncbi:MAG: hypothetical protein H7145_05835 [Akkermansiaceae bacterium]|nr:hypothetical protein [Armatimonadota bacterium]